MVNLDHLGLLEEKLKLLDGLNYSALRTFALAILVVACAKSSLALESKAIIIAGAVFAYALLVSLVTQMASLANAQDEMTNFAQLTMISLEAQRLSPEDRRSALEIQGHVEKQASESSEYKRNRGSISEALAHHIFGSCVKLAIVGTTIAVTWMAWAHALKLLAYFS